MRNNILIYGANGYTGKLIAKTLINKDLKPILAARSNKIAPIGKALNCETRIFSTSEAADFLADIDLLINLAGPFSNTQDDLIQACIDTHTHYLDIAGEVPEMKRAFQYADKAKKAEVAVIAGAGFGVVPTDIAAKLATDQIKNPTNLTIAYATEGGASRGTLYTVLKDINKAGIKVINGQEIVAKPASSNYTFNFGNKTFQSVYNPWRADLFTAKLSTSIKNIETYAVFPSFVVSMMKGKLAWLRNLILNYAINWLPEGPSEKELRKGKTFVVATAKNDQQTATIKIEGPEAYVFTAECIYAISTELLKGNKATGFITPSLFGKSLIENMDKVKISLV